MMAISWWFLSVCEGDLDNTTFWTTSRFNYTKTADYSLLISMNDSWLGLHPCYLFIKQLDYELAISIKTCDTWAAQSTYLLSYIEIKSQ